MGRWLIYLQALAAWTVGLLTPHPIRVGARVLPPELRFWVAKALHVSAYAALAALLAWLPIRPRWRWLGLALLVLHGCATEYLQTFVEGRTGSLRDVGLDSLGLALGLALSWRWWRHPATRRTTLPKWRPLSR